MFFAKFFKKNMCVRSSLLTMILAVTATVSILLAMFQVTAWFKNFHSTSTDAVLTNFETKIEYSIGSEEWATLEPTKGIPVILQNNAVKLDVTRVNSVSVTPNSLQIRITYTGKSNAYLRFSAFGSFYNADTKTYLPQQDSLWSMSGSNWKSDQGYWYYTKKLGCEHDPEKTVDKFSETHVLGTITVTLDASKLASVVSPHQDYQGDLFIYVDAVQPDRFQEFWGLDQLPF